MFSVKTIIRILKYCLSKAHSSVEKNCMISMMRLRKLQSDENNSLRGDTLREAIQQDKEKGLIPFFVSAVLTPNVTLTFLIIALINYENGN